MIKKQSDDPDVQQAAAEAKKLIDSELTALPSAEMFDYGGHNLHLGEYEVCKICTSSIAEAQQAQHALLAAADSVSDPVIREHVLLAAHLFELEAEAAIVRAEFHNGIGTESILNRLLGYQYDRHIHDDFNHSHHQGK